MGRSVWPVGSVACGFSSCRFYDLWFLCPVGSHAVGSMTCGFCGLWVLIL